MHASIEVSPPRPVAHTVAIELHQQGPYRQGDLIRGRVMVDAGADERCKSLAIELQLYTEGRGRAVALVAEQHLFTGNWQSGQRYEYLFELTVPTTNPLYQGKLFQTFARVAAVFVGHGKPASAASSLTKSLTGIDTGELAPRGFPAAALPVEIAADSRPLVVGTNALRTEKALRRTGTLVLTGFIVLLVGLPLAAYAASVLLGPIEYDFSNNPFVTALVLGVLGVLLTFFGAGILFVHLGSWMAQRKIGIPDIAIKQVDNEAGPALGISIQVAPDASVQGVRARIRAVELVTVGHDENTREKEHEVCRQYLELSLLEAGRYRGELPITELSEFPPTGIIGGARIEWRLGITVRLPWWPDWNVGVPIHAFPGGERPTLLSRYTLRLS